MLPTILEKAVSVALLLTYAWVYARVPYTKSLAGIYRVVYTMQIIDLTWIHEFGHLLGSILTFAKVHYVRIIGPNAMVRTEFLYGIQLAVCSVMGPIAASAPLSYFLVKNPPHSWEWVLHPLHMWAAIGFVMCGPKELWPRKITFHDGKVSYTDGGNFLRALRGTWRTVN